MSSMIIHMLGFSTAATEYYKLKWSCKHTFSSYIKFSLIEEFSNFVSIRKLGHVCRASLCLRLQMINFISCKITSDNGNRKAMIFKYSGTLLKGFRSTAKEEHFLVLC